MVNNQIVDWSFKLDGIMHNASQEAVFTTTATDVVTAALDGYNGTFLHLILFNAQSSYASAVWQSWGSKIVSVSPPACFVTKRRNILPTYRYHMKGYSL